MNDASDAKKASSAESQSDAPAPDQAAESAKPALTAEQKQKRFAGVMLVIALVAAGLAGAFGLIGPDDGDDPDTPPPSDTKRQLTISDLQPERMDALPTLRRITLVRAVDPLLREEQGGEASESDRVSIDLRLVDGVWRLKDQSFARADAASVEQLIERLRSVVKPKRPVDRIDQSAADSGELKPGWQALTLFFGERELPLVMHDRSKLRRAGSREVFDVSESGPRRLLPDGVRDLWQPGHWRSIAVPLIEADFASPGELEAQMQSIELIPAQAGGERLMVSRSAPLFGAGEWSLGIGSGGDLRAGYPVALARVRSLASYMTIDVPIDAVHAQRPDAAMDQVVVTLKDEREFRFEVTSPWQTEGPFLLRLPHEPCLYEITRARAQQLLPSAETLLGELRLATRSTSDALNHAQQLSIQWTERGEDGHHTSLINLEAIQRDDAPPVWREMMSSDGTPGRRALKEGSAPSPVWRVALKIELAGAPTQEQIEAALAANESGWTSVSVDFEDGQSARYQVLRRGDGESAYFRVNSQSLIAEISARDAQALAPTLAELLPDEE